MDPDFEKRKPRAVQAQKLTVSADPGECAIEDALIMLRRNIFDPVIIMVTNMNAGLANAYAEKFGAHIIVVPDDFVKHPDHWMVIAGNGAVWSPGA